MSSVVFTSPALFHGKIAGQGLTGKRGNDVYVKVPLGTIVSEKIDAMVRLCELFINCCG